MKIFENQESWESKVNFVDENNVLVGYDMGQSCCEHADWFIAESPHEDIEDIQEVNVDDINLEGFVFDTSYFKEVYHGCFEDGGMVIFRLEGPTFNLYLHLFNCHNGYYSHGFEFKNDGQSIRDGYL